MIQAQDDANNDEENPAKKRRYDVVRPESDKENIASKAATKLSRKLAQPHQRKQSAAVLADKQTNAPGALKAQAEKTAKNKTDKATMRLDVFRDDAKKANTGRKRGRKEEPKPERLTRSRARRFEKVKPDLRTSEEIEYSKTFGRRW